MINNQFTLASLLFSILLNIVYFSKKRIESVETKIYSFLVAINFITILFAIFSAYTIMFSNELILLNNFVSKSLLVCYGVWTTFFTLYVYSISTNKKGSIRKIIKILLPTATSGKLSRSARGIFLSIK